MSSHYLAAKRESKAKATGKVRDAGLEDALLLVYGDFHPVVFYLQADTRNRLAVLFRYVQVAVHSNESIMLGRLDGVVEQILHYRD